MTSKPRILIVEDNQDLADNVAELFSDLDGIVVTEINAAAALKAAERGLDLAILDIRLSGDVDAIELMPALRSKTDCEIILMTGYGTMDSAIAAVRHGAFAYVLKPFDPKDLYALSKRALERVYLRRDRDELARKLAESAALAEVGRLTAGLAHEIRNPLNAAKLQLELLNRHAAQIADAGLQEKIIGRAAIVHEEIHSLGVMLDDFLSLARPTALRLEGFDLSALVAEIVEIQGPVAKERGVELNYKGEPELMVRGDREKVKQVLLNLMVNALDAASATSKPGEIMLNLAKADHAMIRVSVSDNGPGIAEDKREQVFSPFFTSKPAGTGLGLSIVERLIHAHGGTITLQNNTTGGLTATFTIPQDRTY